MRLWTDFNYMENEDRVWADLTQAGFYLEEELQVGRKAELFDGLGYECTGTIVQVDTNNRMVEVEPDWSTWRSTKRPGRNRGFVASTKYEGVLVGGRS